jgi:hypothetical protein
MAAFVTLPNLNFPQINPQVLQDPGIGSTIASGLAQVLAAQQQQKENEYRQQQLMMAQQQAQQQAQYQQATLGIQQQQLSAQTTEQASVRAGRAQVGGAQRRALGVPQTGTNVPTPGAVPSQPTTSTFGEVLQGGAAALAPAQGNPDIFGGVSDENLPAAVQGVQEVQALQPKEQEPTNDVKNFAAWAQLNGVSPEMAKKFWELIGPKPGTVVNNNVGGGEQQFDKSWNEAQAKDLADAEQGARKAATASVGMSEAYGLVGKSLTGLGSNAKLNLSRTAIALGVAPEAVKEAAGNTQTLMKLTGDRVLDLMATKILGGGTAVSDTDLRFSQEQSGRDLSKEPGALKKTIRINMGAGMMLQQDAVDKLREQATYSNPQTAKQLLGKATGLENRLGTQWLKYAAMLRDEGQSVDEILARVPARIREQYGAQIRQEYGAGKTNQLKKIRAVIGQ